MSTRAAPVLARRALRVVQADGCPLYLFTLTAGEILQIADISRVSRGGGDIIGYQRPEVRAHVDEIVQYLDSDEAILPNPIIIALSSAVRFVGSRGPHVIDGCATAAGTIEIPLSSNGDPKPGWIVDGQQRALALSMARRQDFAVPVNAFVADSVDLQRDQFLRINNTKPLPRGLVTELLPSICSPLPPRLALRQTPSALCDLLNTDEASPFRGLIRRPSMSADDRRRAPVVDTSVVQMLQESLASPSGCLYPFRNLAAGETDFAAVWSVLLIYWTTVREVFDEAWGRPPAKSRLMHGAGIRAMGRLMDRIMATVDVGADDAPEVVRRDLELVAPACRWTAGTWDELDLRWNDVQNVGRHINALSNFLVRTYVQAKAAVR